MLVDAHVHCLDLEEVESYALSGKYELICVIDELLCADKIFKLSEQYQNVEPCVGIHPWLAHEHYSREVSHSLGELIENYPIKCLGEVGLDKKFKPDTLEKQLEIFNVFVEYAKEYDLVLNLHAAGAWIEVFETIYKRDINRAYFHWYTGPIELLYQIESVGYYIGINPAWKVQQKHRNIIEEVDINRVLTESDAPYRYRGLLMTPDLIKDTVEYISEVKELDLNTVEKIIYTNFKTLFKKP